MNGSSVFFLNNTSFEKVAKVFIIKIKDKNNKDNNRNNYNKNDNSTNCSNNNQ